MEDIVVAAIIGGTCVVWSSLSFARWLLSQRDPRVRHIAEKRRILERDRAEWMESDDGNVRASKSARIDRELLKLADEEARLLRGEDDA